MSEVKTLNVAGNLGDPGKGPFVACNMKVIRQRPEFRLSNITNYSQCTIFSFYSHDMQLPVLTDIFRQQ